jgi:integrase
MKKINFSSPFTDDIKRYLDYRSALGRGNRIHEEYLKQFDGYCAQYFPDADILTQELVIGWIHYVAENGNGGLDVKGRSIRALGKFLSSEGKQAYILPEGYTTTKRSSAFSPYIMSESEMTAFFVATDSMVQWHCGDMFSPMIAPVLFRMMYTCGLRPDEIRHLEIQDVNTANGEILIRKNKVRKERIIVMSDDMSAFCREYEAKRSFVFVRSKYFFPRVDGKAYSSQQLRKLCLHCWILSHPEIPVFKLPRIRPYDFRHCYASTILQKWLDEGRDLFTMLPYLRAYMGHDHINDTAYYIHILPEKLLRSPEVNWTLTEDLMPGVEVWED